MSLWVSIFLDKGSKIEQFFKLKISRFIFEPYGRYMFYASFLISPIPGFLVNRLKACMKTTDERAEMHGLTLLLALAVVLAVVISIQMCIKGSVANGIARARQDTEIRSGNKIQSIRPYVAFPKG